MLDEDRDEPLERAAHGPVDDHRPMLGVVVAHVDQVESFGRRVVELNGAQLPAPADRVGDVEIDLRAVERPVARLELVRHAGRLEGAAQRGLRAIPHLVAADPRLRPGGEPEAGLQPERAVVGEDEVHQELHLVHDLALRQKHVAVVLGELPHAGEPRERAGHLVPVQHVEGDVAERELAVRMLLGGIEQVVRRAVHRLERGVGVARLLVEHHEHVLAVLAPVSRQLPQHLVEDERRLDLPERARLPLAHVIGQQVVQRRPALGPEGRARRRRMEHEEVELLADAPMVALPRLLQPVQIGVELLLLEPGRAVNPLQHLPALVAPPVRAGGREQLEVLEPAGAGDVRAAAEILERSVGVDADRLVVAQLADPLELERVVGESAIGLRPVHDFPHERIVPGRHLGHLRLDAREILGRERPVHLEVVVEPVLDRRPEADAGAREELPHRRRQDVRRGVPQHLQRVGVAVGEDREGDVGVERAVEVPHDAVHPRGERRARQAGADRLGDLAGGGARGHLADAAIRQRDPDGGAHGPSCTAGRAGGSLIGA